MNGSRFRGNQFDRFRRGEFGGFDGGWGFWLGSDYWGFEPWWYGGFPFWYATLGYGDYWDPYYDGDAYEYGGYDYGVPIAQQSNAQPSGDDQFFAAARAAFYAGNYAEASQDIDQAIAYQPMNQDVHEFHALVLFALGHYQQAAAVAHTVLNAGPGWDWTILQSLYPSPDVYTGQLRALEHYIGDHKDQASTRFLLGYQYLMLGHLNAARRQFNEVVELQPRDTLTKNILSSLENAPGIQPQPAAQAAKMENGKSAVSAQLATFAANMPLVGQWKSRPAPGVTVQLSLAKEGHFTWSVMQGGRNQTFSGIYVRQGDDLVLTRQDGQQMDGILTTRAGNEFRFRLRNAAANDPGLGFSK
jgi:tetratricopeptide (TPR) repeat protein